MSETRQRIGLFGGTFDPIHMGHMAMAMAAKEALCLDRVIMIPCAISPHKSDAPAAGECRLEMIRIASKRHPWLESDWIELERRGPSFSWETAEEFRRRYPEARMFWVLGEDQWEALPRWEKPERLAALVEFVVMGRDGRDGGEREGFRAWFLPGVHGASAMRIREVLRGGGDPGPDLLDPRVMKYIRRRGLYEEGQ